MWFLVRNMEAISGIPEDPIGCMLLMKRMVVQGDLDDHDILELFPGTMMPLVASVSIWKRLFRDPDFSIDGLNSLEGESA